MKVKICKWYGNADSPVLLWVDDLANAWVDVSGKGIVEPEADWGYAKDGENSAFGFLRQKLLSRFPRVKATFFVPVGKRSGVVASSSIKIMAAAINSDEGTMAFFRSVHENPMFEIAYHGTTHGIAGERSEDFVQEWDAFNSLEEAVAAIEKGKGIYMEALGCCPKGGKYCGYKAGRFGDESIDKSGFLWWCRNSSIGSHDASSLDISTFGENGVIDIPTTLEGNIFNKYIKPDGRILQGAVKRIFKNKLLEIETGKIDRLLGNGLVVSIQEHISPARNDGRRQTPNIFDDMESLHMIFEYMRGKNVWYCTGSELAEYCCCRDKSVIEQNGDEFAVKCAYDKSKLSSNILSLKVEGGTVERMIMPNGVIVECEKGVYNIEIMEGTYKLLSEKQL